LVGLVLPARFTGPKLLETELVQNGIPRGTIPLSCLREFVDEEIVHARADTRAWGGIWKERLVGFLEGRAIIIVQVMNGARGGDIYDRTAAILAKHKVKLDNRR
jgi:hypothetical protein